MADESIIIIGAGIAGLSTGCYGQMNGYRTQIFELHTLPGGLLLPGNAKDIPSTGASTGWWVQEPAPASIASGRSWALCKGDA